MGIYDIAMLIIFGGAIFFGYWKGLAWQIASLAALIVSYIVAVTFSDPVSRFIQTDPPWNRIGAMLGLFLVTSLVIWTIYASVSKTLKKHELKGFDRQSGAMLGAVKGALLCMVATMFAVSYFGESAHEAVHHSRLGAYVEKGIWQVSAIVPKELANFVNPAIKSYKEAVAHGEPVVNLQEDINDILGTTYQTGPALDQDPSQLPPGDPYQGPGYPGQWQTTPATNQQQPTNQNNYQYGTNYGTQPNSGSQIWNQSNTAGGYQGGFQPSTSTQNQPANNPNDWSNMSISDATKQLLEKAKQKGLEMGADAGAEAARRLFESGQNR